MQVGILLTPVQVVKQKISNKQQEDVAKNILCDILLRKRLNA